MDEKAAAADPGTLRLHQPEHHLCCDRCIHCRTAGAQDLQGRFHGVRIGGGRHRFAAAFARGRAKRARRRRTRGQHQRNERRGNPLQRLLVKHAGASYDGEFHFWQ